MRLLFSFEQEFMSLVMRSFLYSLKTLAIHPTNLIYIASCENISDKCVISSQVPHGRDAGTKVTTQ